MPYIDPQHLLDIMIADIAAKADISTSGIIKGALRAASHIREFDGQVMALVTEPLGFEFNDDFAEILVTWNTRGTIERVRQAFRDRRLKLEVRSLRPGRARGNLLSGILDEDECDHEDVAIFGLIEGDCVLCVRHHVRLNCLTLDLH
jgi:hypothetical protein